MVLDPHGMMTDPQIWIMVAKVFHTIGARTNIVARILQAIGAKASMVGVIIKAVRCPVIKHCYIRHHRH